jgi:hypothetical protein
MIYIAEKKAQICVHVCRPEDEDALAKASRVCGLEDCNASAQTSSEGVCNERSFEDLLSSAVDETMKQVFSEEGASVIYRYLENDCRL